MATMPRPVVADPVSVRPVHPEQVEHLLKLQKWSRKITSILDLDELIDHVVNDVSCAFGCVETNLYLHDEDHGELEAAGIHGCKVHEKGSRLKVGKEGMVGYVASTLQMRYAPDVRKDRITSPVRNRPGPKWPFLCLWMGSWWVYFRPRIMTSTLSRASSCACCKGCATTWRWPYGTRGASSTNGTSVSG